VNGTVSIASEYLRVDCLPEQGFVISSVVDLSSGAEAIWMRRSHRVEPCTRSLGGAGDASIGTFLDRWPGGWFEMFPTVGYPMPGDETSFLHGELVRLPWDITARGGRCVEARIQTLRSPFVLTRALEVIDHELEIRERIENVADHAADYLWGHHPCFDRATFAGGRVGVAASRTWVPEPYLEPTAAILRLGEFEWPLAAHRDDGSAVDVERIPDSADGRVDHVCFALSAGALEISAPRFRRSLRITFEIKHFPYLLLWQNFRSAAGWPFWGDVDTFALEWSCNVGRSVADAKAAGAVRSLSGKGAIETTIRIGWMDLA
jgi:hypothetical protein